MMKPSQSLQRAKGQSSGAARWVPAMAALAFCAMATSANAQSANTREQAALDVRYLQTELMVAALSCGRPDYHQHYNVFVAKFGGTLSRHGSALKSYFNRQYGGQGTVQMDRYVTRLANEASLRSMQQATFCQDAGTLFQRVTSLEPTSLDSFSAAIARSNETVASGRPTPR